MNLTNPRLDHGSPLEAASVDVAYEKRTVIRQLSIEIAHGGITALVGPNGSGKSTLLKALARLLAPSSGTVLLEGESIVRLPAREVARRLAILPQGPTAPAGLSVAELVEQGRFPHTGALRMLRRQDHNAIAEAMRATGMEDFAHRPVEQLSGGERQRAWIALALAQSTRTLLLDEPTTFLDIGHQLEVLDLVAELNRTKGITVVMVLHDLNQAARYASRMVVLNAGAIVADGPPADVLTEQVLSEVFGVRAHLMHDPIKGSGTPMCVPYETVRGRAMAKPAAP